MEPPSEEQLKAEIAALKKHITDLHSTNARSIKEQHQYHQQGLHNQREHHRQKMQQLNDYICKLQMEIENLRRQLECAQEQVLDIDARDAGFLREDNKRLLVQLKQLQDSHEHLKCSYEEQKERSQQNLHLLQQLYMHMREFRKDEHKLTQLIEELVRQPMMVLSQRYEAQDRYLRSRNVELDDWVACKLLNIVEIVVMQ